MVHSYILEKYGKNKVYIPITLNEKTDEKFKLSENTKGLLFEYDLFLPALKQHIIIWENKNNYYIPKLMETLTKSTFIYENLSKVFLFSGYLSNILAKDEKLLDILQPEYAMRLNGNITFYKNSLDKLDISHKDEESLLNSMRKNHRLLKFQILFALINQEINIKQSVHRTVITGAGNS